MDLYSMMMLPIVIIASCIGLPLGLFIGWWYIYGSRRGLRTSVRAVGGTRRPPAPDTMSSNGYPPLEVTKHPRIYWKLPKISEILAPNEPTPALEDADRQRASLLVSTLASLGVAGRVVEVVHGPTVTWFGFAARQEPGQPPQEVRSRVEGVKELATDLAVAMACGSVQVVAPNPSRLYVAIGIPEEDVVPLRLRPIMASDAFTTMKSAFGFPLGLAPYGEPVVRDLTELPHILICGMTGSGKSFFLRALLASLLLQNTPDDLKLIIVDTKMVEYFSFHGIPHLLGPVIIETDRAMAVLIGVRSEIERRLGLFTRAGSTDLEHYNRMVAGQGADKLPHIVLIVDELADVVRDAKGSLERPIHDITQLGQRTGVHLVISTQRPSADVMSPYVKSSFPGRIVFAVASARDSQVCLDHPGAELLRRRGEMLFLDPDQREPLRLQGVCMLNTELELIRDYWQGWSSRRSEQPDI